MKRSTALTAAALAALATLSAAYCLLPCALKLLAATLLYTMIIRRTP